MATFEQEGIDQIKQVGGLYGLPVSSSVVALFYNKDIFDKFGVPYPKDGMTWDDTLELAKKLNRTADGKTYVGYWIDPKPYLRNNQLSAGFVDPKTKKASLNNDSWKRIIETVYRDFAANEQMKSLIGKWPSKDIFLKDKIAAMYAEDFSKVFTTKEFNEMNWDMVALPTFKDLPKVGSQATYDYLTIPSFSKNKDQAMDVIKYLTSVEFQTAVSRQGYIPAIKDASARNVLGQDTKFKDKNLKAIYYNKVAKSAPISAYDDFVAEDGLDKSQLREVVGGTTDVNTALRKAEEIANAKIADTQGADKGK
jgi:multiple sugar transport system substrate-binding protein